MGLIPAFHTPQAQAQTTKTKAKQRYLKAKKDRKKHKNPPKSGHSAPVDHDESSGDEEELNAPVEASSVPLPASPVEKPRKKKRKLEHKDDSPELIVSEALVPDPLPDEGSMAEEVSAEPAHELDPEPEAEREPEVETLPYLPSFPLPTQPAPPPASVLYLQGLDEALITAEVVDPSRTQTLSSTSEADPSRLSLKTRQRLSELGILELFAVQTAILPFLLPSATSLSSTSLYSPYDPPRDLCVSAPTGSGKTLAYVLPIIEALSNRIVTRLRALIVLPTRDLVTQVRETFEALCKGRNLKIGIATGQHSFAQEKAQIVGDSAYRLEGGQSKVDILICTPGRLMDHLNGTPNFTLQHLRFLVIDEADRLVTQAFQDWLAQVLAATNPPYSSSTSTVVSSSEFKNPDIPLPDALSPAWLPSSTISGSLVRTDLSEPKYSSCQKLLFSATLTHDPSKIAALKLRDAKYFVVGDGAQVGADEGEGEADAAAAVIGERFAFPEGLKEHMVICSTAQKPLHLLSLVHTHEISNALVFTKSAESTSRLVKLVEFFESSYHAQEDTTMAVDGEEGEPEKKKLKLSIQAYSSDLSTSERKSILDKFKAGTINILVCSDLISRGIDIPHVSHVISYDAPVDMRKYVHRVGRTARAGRSGEAWSLVEEQEARWFKNMLRASNHLGAVSKVRVQEKTLEPLMPHYDAALEKLKEVYARNSNTR